MSNFAVAFWGANGVFSQNVPMASRTGQYGTVFKKQIRFLSTKIGIENKYLQDV